MGASPPRPGERSDGLTHDDPVASSDACPRCATPYADDQEYCLNCGLRLPRAGEPPPIAGRLPWSRAEWIWPVALGFVIAAVGAATAIAFARDEGDVFVATTRPFTTATQDNGVPTGTQPPATRTQPPTTTPRTDDDRRDRNRANRGKRPRPTARLTSWPPGKSGYTIVLASVPTSVGRPIALAQARRAARAGLTDVGVLRSSGYSSLHPGYHVVFTGVYRSQSQADDALPTAIASGFEDAYTTRIVP